ncbi:MAG: aspartyl/asparaginyl beta-hydroxylase domain-containing protein [Sphingomonas sp.]
MRLPQAVVPLFSWPLDAILAALPGEEDPLWELWSRRQERFPAHRSTRTIRFIWLESLEPGVAPAIERVDDASPELQAAVLACGEAIAGHHGGRVARLMLTEMAPDTAIPRHVDAGDLLTHTHRCHLAVVTNPRVRFEVGDESFHFAAGQVYEFDNLRRHAVVNMGESRRVHLICNVLPAERSLPEPAIDIII